MGSTWVRVLLSLFNLGGYLFLWVLSLTLLDLGLPLSALPGATCLLLSWGTPPWPTFWVKMSMVSALATVLPFLCLCVGVLGVAFYFRLFYLGVFTHLSWAPLFLLSTLSTLMLLSTFTSAGAYFSLRHSLLLLPLTHRHLGPPGSPGPSCH